MDMYVDQTGRHDQTTGVNLFNFGLGTANCGLRRNFSVDNQNVGDFVPFVGGIDDAAVADNRCAHAAIPPHR